MCLTYHYFHLTSVSLAVSAGPLAVRPLLCLLWGGWYHLLHIDLPQPNRGLLSAASWRKPLCAAMAPETSLLYRKGTTTSGSCHWVSLYYECRMIKLMMYSTTTLLSFLSDTHTLHSLTVLHYNYTQAEIRTTLSPLYEVLSNNSGPAINFVRSRVERMSERWTRAGLRMRQSSNKTGSTQMRV